MVQFALIFVRSHKFVWNKFERASGPKGGVQDVLHQSQHKLDYSNTEILSGTGIEKYFCEITHYFIFKYLGKIIC